MATSCALTNLLRHFSPIKYKECGAKFNTWKSRQDPPVKKLRLKGEKELPSLKQTVTDLNEKFGDFIISAEMPFTFLKIPEFITFCKGLNPNYVLPSIYKLKNNILKKKREIGDERLREELKLSNYVTLTIDGWSTRSLVSMMSKHDGSYSSLSAGNNSKSKRVSYRFFKRTTYWGESCEIYFRYLQLLANI